MNPQFSRYYTYIRPIFRNKFVKTYSSTVFSLIMITVFSLFAIKPTLSTIVSLQKSIKEQKNLLNQIITKGENLSLGKNNYEQISDKTKTDLIGLVPDSTAVSNLMNTLAEISGDYEASISALQVQPVALRGQPNEISKDAKVKEIDFTININGSFTKLARFLADLSKLPRLIRVESVGLSKTEQGGLSMTVNAKAFFFQH